MNSAESVASSNTGQVEAAGVPGVGGGHRLQRDPRSIGSLVSLESASATYNDRSTSPPTNDHTGSSRTLCEIENQPEVSQLQPSDPVLNRIKRDCERKEEFLRRPTLPNYLGNIQPPMATPEADFIDYESPHHRSGRASHPVLQDDGRPPVYFGDRYPMNNRDREVVEADGTRRPSQQGGQAEAGGPQYQPPLYGLPLGPGKKIFKKFLMVAE